MHILAISNIICRDISFIEQPVHSLHSLSLVLNIVGPRLLFSGGCRKGWEGVFWLMPLQSIAFLFPVLNAGVQSCRNCLHMF